MVWSNFLRVGNFFLQLCVVAFADFICWLCATSPSLPSAHLPQVKPNSKQEMLFHIFKWHINNRSVHSLYARSRFFKAWKRNQYKQILVGEGGRMHFLWGEEFLIISLSAGFQLERFSALGRFSNQQFSWGQLSFETDQPVGISSRGPSSHPHLCFLPWEHSRPPISIHTDPSTGLTSGSGEHPHAVYGLTYFSQPSWFSPMLFYTFLGPNILL